MVEYNEKAGLKIMELQQIVEYNELQQAPGF
jgi:hypothetical protein